MLIRAGITAALLTAVALAVASPSRAACVAGPAYGSYERAGVEYEELPARAPLASGPRASGLRQTRCDDTNNPPPDVRIPTRRIPGVAPEIALASPSGRRVFLATGFLPELRSHPLHARVRLRRSPPARSCSGRRVVVRGGTLGANPYASLYRGQYIEDRPVRLSFRPDAVVYGLRARGLPYLAGQRVVAAGVLCRRGTVLRMTSMRIIPTR